MLTILSSVVVIGSADAGYRRSRRSEVDEAKEP